MNPLQAKEIRLLLPGYLVALALAVAPTWMFPVHIEFTDGPGMVLYSIGLIVLALSPFGREFGLSTFGLLLAQPRERQRTWRMKASLLAVALGTVVLTWMLSYFLRHQRSHYHMGGDAVVYACTAAVVAYAGGLWSTLLFRQVSAAFWFSILVPGGITVWMHEADAWKIVAVLLLYAGVGIWFARHLFLRAQDAEWTGGEVALPSLFRRQTTTAQRRYRPLLALVGKELKLHQMALVGIFWLFLLHLAAVWVRLHRENTIGGTAGDFLGLVGGIWFIVPLMVGSLGVAEERKLGTLAEQFSLPVSRWKQFGLKFFLAVFVGGFLSFLGLLVAEGIGQALNDPRGMFGANFSPLDVLGLIGAFLGMACFGFYASTLARNIIQSLATAILGMTAIWVLAIIAMEPDHFLGLPVWRGYLVCYFAWPAMALTVLWLTWTNFRSATGSDHLWRKNVLTVGSVLLGAALLTGTVYNRVWEYLAPVEPRPGPAVIATGMVKFDTMGASSLGAVLPDGRMWVDRVWYGAGRRVLYLGHETGFCLGGHWYSASGSQLFAGSNWTKVAVNFRETVALRKDGTLWVSEEPRRPVGPDPTEGATRFSQASGLVQLGSESNWQDMVHEYWQSSVVLLKNDGTLWRLGTNNYAGLKAWKGLRQFEPLQLVAEGGWQRIVHGPGQIFAFKADGVAFSIHSPERNNQARVNNMGVVLERAPLLDGARWLRFTTYNQVLVGLREDGTLWAWTTEPLGGWPVPPGARLLRIGPGSDWVELSGDNQSMVARKKDGSIWHWPVVGWDRHFGVLQEPPIRLGSRTDWVGVGSAFGGVMSLGADGNLLYWANRRYPSDEQPMLRPSRQAQLVENLFVGLQKEP
jgi:hypothetical protein